MTTPLYEQYRPSAWGDVVGQDKVIKRITAMRDRGLTGRAYWISGKTGTGKTTIARLIAREVAEDVCIEELDATTLTPSKLADIEMGMQTYGWGKGGRAYIVNEAHGLRRDTIRQLLVLLERIPGHVVVVFTTTVDGQDRLFEDVDDASPLLSRCIQLPLTARGIAQLFAARVQEIAVAEGLDGQPIEAYVKLANSHKSNMRAMLQAVEACEMME